MSAQIPETMPLSDLLKPTGYDCPKRLQGKTFTEATISGGNISIEANKEVTISENGATIINPSEGKDVMEKVTVNVNVPSSGGSGANLEDNKEVSILANGIVEITPTKGKDGMKKVTANVNIGGSGVKFVVSKSYNSDNSNNNNLSSFLLLQSLKANNIHDGDTITTMLNYDYGAGTYADRELILITVGEVPLYKVPNSPINGDTRDALFIGNPYLAGIEGWGDNGCPIFTVWYADSDGGYTYNYTPDYPNYGSAEVGNMGNYRGRIKIGDSIKICTSDFSTLADTLEDISSENYLRAQRQLFIKG